MFKKIVAGFVSILLIIVFFANNSALAARPIKFFSGLSEFRNWIENPEINVVDSSLLDPEPTPDSRDYENTIYSDYHKMFVIDKYYLLPLVPDGFEAVEGDCYISLWDVYFLFEDANGNRLCFEYRTDGYLRIDNQNVKTQKDEIWWFEDSLIKTETYEGQTYYFTGLPKSNGFKIIQYFDDYVCFISYSVIDGSGSDCLPTIVDDTVDTGSILDRLNFKRMPLPLDEEPSPSPPDEKSHFTDVFATDWFYSDVEYVYTYGLMIGTGLNTFSPNVSLNRGMIVTMLYRQAGEPDVSSLPNPFTDVSEEKWYTNSVKWAYANGVVNGTSTKTYAPDDPITRQDLGTILYRYNKEILKWTLPIKRTYPGFGDDDLIADYAKAAVKQFYESGIINGKSATTFDPRGSATRAEAAAMLHRFLTALE